MLIIFLLLFQTSQTLFRFILLFSGGLLATFGSRRADIAGAGALGCLTMAFVSGLRWRQEQKNGDEVSVVTYWCYVLVMNTSKA